MIKPSKPKIVALIQARMGAARLFGKIMMLIAGKPMLSYVFKRTKLAKNIDEVIVTTTSNLRDNIVETFCQENGIPYFRGSELDVLDRFYQAAKQNEATIVIRITADCPLIDPDVISKALDLFQSGKYDYVSNTLISTYPDGLDVEVFSMKALQDAWQNAKNPVEREHVTPYIKNQPKFSKGHLKHSEDLSHFRWTVDEQVDLDFANQIYTIAKGNIEIRMQDILKILKENPKLATNSHITANEGYYTSFMKEPGIPAKELLLKNSQALKDRASRVIPSCTQTFSKGPTQFTQGVSPIFLESAHGAYVTDVDGNKFIDYAMAIGPIILGYNDPVVMKAVEKQLKSGTIFSLPHPLEVELAETLRDLIPCAEMVRFGKNGSDATAGAVRLARAITGRDVVACSGYHGWQDWYIGTTTRNLGVPKAARDLTIPFQYNNIESLERIFLEKKNQVACVIMEAVGIEAPKEDFLRQVKEMAEKNGALLIFDEVITGFRFALGGAQEYFGVTPDLACFGKAMANGYPISAVVGPERFMKLFDEVFYSFTFGGECLSIAAALATIERLKTLDAITHIWQRGKKLKDGYNQLAKAYQISALTQCVGYSPRTVMQFRDEKGNDSYLLKSVIQQECLKRGLLFTGYQFVSAAHTDQIIDDTLRVFRSVFEIVSNAVKSQNLEELLEGELVQPVFRKA